MERVDLLLEISERAGTCLATYFGREIEVRKKSRLDLVTEADEAAESLIVAAIQEAFPTDEILAEEGGRHAGTSGWQWIVDPLDGTTNFAHGFPQFCVSAALARDGVLEAGVIYDPIKRECFVGRKGQGATLNGEPIAVADKRELVEALAVTGFSYDRRERMDDLLDRVRRILNHCQGLRRLGSAALDMAYVACGRFDLFLEDGLNAWDVAAGTLIVREAGGRVCDFSGDGPDFRNGQIIAGNAHLIAPARDHLLPESS